MDGNTIRRDKDSARAAIKGLAIYAGQAACQGKVEEVSQARRGVDGALDVKVAWMGGM